MKGMFTLPFIILIALATIIGIWWLLNLPIIKEYARGLGVGSRRKRGAFEGEW